MKRIFFLMCLLTLAGCASGGGSVKTQINTELDDAAKMNAKASNQDEVNNALLPPVSPAIQQHAVVSVETKFDLSVNNTPAHQVFMAIVSGTRYSMLLDPEIGGNITLNLKDVTVFDALESIREMYGYEYKIDGTRIYVLPISLQTRIYQVNYLTGLREGRSSLRVSSGSVSDNPTSGMPGVAGVPVTPTVPGANNARNNDSSRVSMTSSTDFWDELSKALKVIVGDAKGRSVVISPMSGVIVVRAMPDELKSVAAFLRASQLSIDRQVILEAKIVEVQLNDSFQAGVNWAGFTNGANKFVAGGAVSQGAAMAPSVAGTPSALSSAVLNSLPGASLTNVAAAAGGLFGIAFQTANFSGLLNFLETQGNVHVLSSPRIATLNNQKAVLKVGTDEFFVTNISSTTTTGTATTTTPSVTLQPFFSGISLDVTPKIDQNDEIILHVHPSVSTVTTVNKSVSLGSNAGGTMNLPLASSSISETDSIVRAHGGQIVAIGGLMRQAEVRG